MSVAKPLVAIPPAPTATAVAARRERSQINIVLFSGGSGTHSITETLLKHPQISLKILINAYDDGHSTGRLRRFIPSMLGPSDVRKNINRLMPVTERSQRNLKQLSDHRLPVGISRNDALTVVEALITGNTRHIDSKISGCYAALTVKHAQRLASFLETFRRYLTEQDRSSGRTFDFTDCALGNLFFAGCYIEQEEDFNRTIRAFSEFYEVDPGVLLNVTQGENLFLVAEKEDGSVLRNEADIVATQSDAKISALYLLDRDTYLGKVADSVEPAGGWSALFRERHVTPVVNPQALQAIAEADVIIYGPGTQHSSLFPSYMTHGVAEGVMGNAKADKIFIGNIHRDHDIPADDANDLARKFLEAMARKGKVEVDWRGLVSQIFLQRTEDASQKAKYVPFDPARFAYPLETVRLKDWEMGEGRHYGGYVLDELQTIIQARIDVELERLQHMVSIVIPVLNEARTIDEVLKSLTALDFQPYGLTKEILVVDGNSTDNTAELARAHRTVKVFELPRRLGRGAALRTGIANARGNLIVFFPGDREYRAEDLHTVVAALSQGRFRAVFGSRAVKCTDLSQDLLRIYENKRGLYLLSKYGGMMLSIFTLLLYNRYVSDVLSSVKGFDGHLLRDLALETSGRELDAEIVAKLSRRKEYLLEVPVDYAPRTRAAGKKITIGDGLRSIWALMRYRFVR